MELAKCNYSDHYTRNSEQENQLKNLIFVINLWAMRDSNSHGFPPHFECGASTNSANRPQR